MHLSRKPCFCLKPTYECGTGKTRTRLPTQMFEGTDLNLANADVDPASPRTNSSSTSRPPALVLRFN